MKTRFRNFYILLLVLFLSFSMGTVSYATEATESAAHNSANFSVSSRSLQVGDTLRVKVWADSPTTLTLTYNNIILNYEGCSVSATADGNNITFSGSEAYMTFTAKSAGQAGLIVSGEGVDRSSANIQVAEAAEEAQESESTESDSQEENSSDDADAPKEDEDSDEEVKKEPTTTIGSAKRYVSLMEPEEFPEGVLVPSELEMEDGGVLSVYQLKGGSNEFYYMYGIDQEENLGWFVYDSSQKSISRVDPALIFAGAEKTQEAEKPSKETKGITIDLESLIMDKRVWLIGGLILLLIIVILIISAILRRTDDEDEDEDYEKEFKSESGHSEAGSDVSDKAEPELPPISVDELPDISDGVWDDEDEERTAVSEKAERIVDPDAGVPSDHSIIGAKRVDIMDLNDL